MLFIRTYANEFVNVNFLATLQPPERRNCCSIVEIPGEISRIISFMRRNENYELLK